jgi:hypothetical protein
MQVNEIFALFRVDPFTSAWCAEWKRHRLVEDVHPECWYLHIDFRRAVELQPVRRAPEQVETDERHGRQPRLPIHGLRSRDTTMWAALRHQKFDHRPTRRVSDPYGDASLRCRRLVLGCEPCGPQHLDEEWTLFRWDPCAGHGDVEFESPTGACRPCALKPVPCV